VREDE
jgi:hypothetical protein